MKTNHRQVKTRNVKRQIPQSSPNIKANFRHRDRGIHGGATRI